MKKDLPLLKNDITSSEPIIKTTDTLQIHAIGIRYSFVGEIAGFRTGGKPAIYSRYR